MQKQQKKIHSFWSTVSSCPAPHPPLPLGIPKGLDPQAVKVKGGQSETTSTAAVELMASTLGWRFSYLFIHLHILRLNLSKA